MASSIRDQFPFGDISFEVISGISTSYPDLPVSEIAGSLLYVQSNIDLLVRMADTLAAQGLTPARWRLLIALRFQAGSDGASNREIAAHLGVKQPTATATVDRAAKDGLVIRRQDPIDGRAVLVAITDHGIDTVDRVLPTVARRLAAFADAMGGPEALTEHSQRLRQATKQVFEDDPIHIDKEQ